MAFSELDRVYIRTFMGFSATFLQGDPRLESAITAIQSVSENGTRPDSSSENYVKGLLYGSAAVTGALPVPGPTAQNTPFALPARQGLVNIKQALDGLIPISYVLAADNREAEIDPARGAAVLRRIGRELVAELSSLLDTPPRWDVFGTKRSNENPYEHIGLGGHNAGGESTPIGGGGFQW